MALLLAGYVLCILTLAWLCAWIHLQGDPRRVALVASLIGIGLPVAMALVAVAARGCALR